MLKEKIEIKEMERPEIYGDQTKVVYVSPEDPNALVLENGGTMTK